jgi:hypothetical protein
MFFYYKLFVIFLTFLLLISPVLLQINQTCEDSLPLKEKDCFNKTGSLNRSFCCYLYVSNNMTQPLCRSIVLSKNLSFPPKTFDINQTEYLVSCDRNYEPADEYSKIGTQCGNSTYLPKKSSDCTKYSTYNNTCCFYQNNITNFSKCFWLGIYSDSTNYKITTQYNVTLSCSENFLKFSFFGKKFKYLILISLMFILFNYK